MGRDALFFIFVCLRVCVRLVISVVLLSLVSTHLSSGSSSSSSHAPVRAQQGGMELFPSITSAAQLHITHLLYDNKGTWVFVCVCVCSSGAV